MLKFLVISTLVVFATPTVNTASTKTVLCYYGTWATYRSGNGKFDVDNIHPNICTHLVYTFVGLSDDGNILFLDPYLDLPDNWGRDNFGKFNALKTKNPELKTILAVGGWNEASAKYSIMANDPALRKVFVRSATETVINYGFDGLDMDWEYPNRRDTVHGQADVENLTLLLRELREAFDQHGLILSAAVSSVAVMASLSYDIPAICKSLDYVNVMTYDMHGAWDDVTGHNAPLHRGLGDEDVPRSEAYTVDVALQYWLDQGCPAEKLLLGAPLYGRTFTLADARNSSVRAPASGAGIAGPYTAQSGTIGYNEFCDLLQTQSWELRYDSLAEVPYAVRERNWVSYDDAASLAIKAQYALELGIAGVMVWSLETDDFHGLCHGETYPLLRSVNRALGRNFSEVDLTSTTGATSSTTSATSAAGSTTAAPAPTPAPGDVCQNDGYAKDPADCSIFYICTRSEDGALIANKFTCPGTLMWDHAERICNYPELVDCEA